MLEGNFRQIQAASPRDARLYRLTEQLAMIFGVCTLILAVSMTAIILRGSLKVSYEVLALLTVPFPVGFLVSAWLHRRIARRHRLM
jgi:ABC-type spermidine/putrescine transport system permease subunit I